MLLVRKNSYTPAVFILACVLLSTCSERNSEPESALPEALRMDSAEMRAAVAAELEALYPAPDLDQLSDLEIELRRLGLVDIRDYDDRIAVDLKYATQDNFLDSAIYGDLDKAYMRIEALAKLSLAQDYLEDQAPGCQLLVFDAARPLQVQQIMWDLVEGSPQQHYVANPSVRSLHNYGAAVDLSIVDSSGQVLDMGSAFDHFGIESQPRHENRLLAQGKLNSDQLANRKLLRTVMEKAGFTGIVTEWWHFNAFGLAECEKRFPLLP